jgi:DNA-binding PadR family transcriptional regulator
MTLPSRERVEPILGSQARRAMRLDVGGKKRLKLIVLLGAYLDANEPSPSAQTLSERLGIDIRTLDALLKLLQRDGFLEIAWQKGRNRRNVYTVHLDGGRS